MENTNKAPPEPPSVVRSSIEMLARLPPPDAPPQSVDFIFHNKLPKSGSSTMKHILEVLSKPNGFTLDHVRISKVDYNQDERLIAHIAKFRVVTLKSRQYQILKLI